MDRYQKVERPKPELPINENEIRITSQGLVRNYINYALTLLQERRGREIVLKAMGQAISKTVAIAEIIKRRVPRLHQDTAISSVSITDVWEPIEEGLLPVEMTRQVSMISITLSPKELNKNSPGYQAPAYVEQSQPTRPQYNYQQRQQPRQTQYNYQQQQQQQQPRQAQYNYQQQQQQQPRQAQYNYQQQQQQQPRQGQYNYQQPRESRAIYNAGDEDTDGRGRGRGQSRGRGRGGGRGWSRGGYGNYQENGGYSNWGQGGGRGGNWGYRGTGYGGRGRGGGGRGYGYGRGRGRMGNSRPVDDGNQA